MSQVVAGKKKASRKKQSKFEKLWQRAGKLRADNEKLRSELDRVVVRIRQTIEPLELEVLQTQKPLLQKLTALGRRKSLTNWQRHTLDEWIREMLQDFQAHGLVDNDLLDDLARYDAFLMGITLEDDEGAAPREQLVELVRQAEAEQQAREQAYEESQQQSSRSVMDALLEEVAQDVERELDRALGPEPAQPEKHTMTEDMWGDELEDAEQSARAQYHARRDELREQLMAEKRAEIEKHFPDGMFDDAVNKDETDDFDYTDSEFWEEFDDSDFDDFVSGQRGGGDSGAAAGDNAPASTALTNETFQRMFRATAGKLHPDREPDPEARKLKQGLMANLLKARKSGDVMTVLEMYETYVGDHDGFSKTDEIQLTAALEKLIDDLEVAKDEIICESPTHYIAFSGFYDPSSKAVDKAFARRVKEIERMRAVIADMVGGIRSLKTLKPWLEQRYDEPAEPSIEDLMRYFEETGPPEYR